MATQKLRQPAFIRHRLHLCSQICREAIVPGYQFVKLTARGSVLILEARRLAGLCRAERSVNNLVVNSSEHVSHTGKEANNLRVALIEINRSRGMQIENLVLTR